MKSVNFAIQLNHTREEELLEFQMSLREIGYDPLYYGLIPFSDEVTGTEDFDKFDVIVPYGTVKLIRLWQKGLLPKSVQVFYHEPSFDQFNYARLIPKELLLNGDVQYTTLGQIKDWQMATDVFIKPTRDLKAFAGVIVSKGQTPGEEIFSRPQDSSLSDSEVVLIAPLREIVKEFRNFVVDGKVIDSSIYKIGPKVTYERPSTEEFDQIHRFFDIVKSHYEPHDVYVVDFALLADGQWVVIEYNCLNCAGMYSVDRRKIFNAIAHFVSQ